jgi:hypothetical protein
MRENTKFELKVENEGNVDEELQKLLDKNGQNNLTEAFSEYLKSLT